jgi:hypothetical protein
VPLVEPVEVSPTQTKGKSKGEPRVRLVVSAQMQVAGYEPTPLRILIDTGSEVNLVRKGLLRPECFRPTPRPIRFYAANQTVLAGGQREVEAILHFAGVDPDSKAKKPLPIPICCYDADIHVDMIVSYAWLVDSQADIIPRRHGLMFHHTDQGVVWVPGSKDPAYAFGAPSRIAVIQGGGA